MPLSARVSLAAQRTIREAFLDLERTISEKDRAGLAGTTLDNVIKAAHDVEDQLAARQLLRNMRRLSPLFTGLQYYSKSIEVLCNGTPYLPWVWAPIKVILKVASDFVDAFEKIIAAYARIAEPLARFKLFDQAYSNNHEIQQTLANFYSDIIKFHKQAYKFVRRSSWKIFFMTSWGRFQRRFDGLIEGLKEHEDLVDRTVNAVHISESKKMREELVTSRREILERAAKDEEERTSNQYVAIVGWLKMDDSEQAKLFESVTTESQKYAGTCDWILQQERTVAWMRCSQESAFLVLQGNPGTGKSVLATNIATFLRSAQKSLVISHICTYSQASSTEYDQILRSILLQLVRSDVDLIAYVYEMFILKKKSVTSQAIERLILETIGAVSDNPAETKYVHIILDGLDECNEEKQPRVINLLERMVSAATESTSAVCKVLMTTCMPSSVAKKLKQKHMVSLSREKGALGRAIELYASHRLGQLRHRWHQMGITDTDIKTLESRLAEKADGMFLWARLVLEYLATNMFVQKNEVLGAIDTLPRELSAFYSQILTQLVSHFDKRSVARLRSILGWIAFAKRPLRKAELRSALSISSDEDKFHIQELAPSYLFDMCTPLIEERSDSTFAFVHVSVKEFLLQSPDSNIGLNEYGVAQEQGLVVASCLLSGLEIFRPGYPERDRSLRVLKGFHGLHLYATEFWVEYVLFLAASHHGLDVESKFFELSIQLARYLNSLPPGDGPLSEQTEDSRLVHLDRQPDLQNAASRILADRITMSEQDRTQPPAQPPERTICEVTGLSTLLSNYQHTVQSLLQLWKYPGVSIQELERFKQDFRSSAFTCRFPGCPFASIGFANMDLQAQHDQSHTPRVSCEVTGCNYPPFSSAQALRNHRIKHHNQGISNIKIRVPENFVRKTTRPPIPRNRGSTWAPGVPDTPVTKEEPVHTAAAPAVSKLATRCWNRLIAWSKAGTIASVSPDRCTVQFRFLRVDPANGSWGLSEPTTCAQIDSTPSNPIEHLSWSNTSSPHLAIINSAGQVALLSFDTSLNTPIVIRKFSEDYDRTGEMIGCLWLELDYLSQNMGAKVKGPRPAATGDGLDIHFGPALFDRGSYTFHKSYIKASGPWYSNVQQSAFIGINRFGTLKVLQPDDAGHFSVNLRKVTESDPGDLICHASMCTDNNQLWIAFTRTTNDLQLIQLIQRGDNGNLDFEFRQRLWVSLDAESLYPGAFGVRGLEMVPSCVGVDPEVTTSVTVFVLASLPTGAEGAYFVKGWSPADKNSMVSLEPVGRTLNLEAGPLVVGLQSISFGKTIALEFDDGSVEYRQSSALERVSSSVDLQQGTNLETAGFLPPRLSTGTQFALSPTHCSRVQLHKDGGVTWARPQAINSFADENTRIDFMSARAAALTLAVCSAAVYEVNIDDLLAVARDLGSESYPEEFLSPFLRDITKLLSVRVDHAMPDQPKTLARNTNLELCLSIISHLGFHGEHNPRDPESKVATLALHTRNVCSFIKAACDPPHGVESPLNDPTVVDILKNYVRWVVFFFAWITKSLYDWSERFDGSTSFRPQENRRFTSHSPHTCWQLMMCSSTRGLLSALCGNMVLLEDACHKLTTAASEPENLPSASLRDMFTSIGHDFTSGNMSKTLRLWTSVQILPGATVEEESSMEIDVLSNFSNFTICMEPATGEALDDVARRYSILCGQLATHEAFTPTPSIISDDLSDLDFRKELKVSIDICGLVDVNPDQRGGKRWRRCARCAAVMEHREARSSQGLRHVLAELDRCICGGYWGLLPVGKLVN